MKPHCTYSSATFIVPCEFGKRWRDKTLMPGGTQAMIKFLIQAAAIAVGILVALGVSQALALLSPFTLSQGHAGTLNQIEYSDFIAILLTAVTVVLGALGFVVALLAFVGWNSIQGRVEDQTQHLISKSLQEDGDLKELVKKSLMKGGSLYKLVQDEANRIIYSGIEPVKEGEGDEEHNGNSGSGKSS